MSGGGHYCKHGHYHWTISENVDCSGSKNVLDCVQSGHQETIQRLHLTPGSTSPQPGLPSMLKIEDNYEIVLHSQE